MFLYIVCPLLAARRHFLPLQALNALLFIKKRIAGEGIDRSLAAVNYLTVAQRGQRLHSSVSQIKYEQSEGQSGSFKLSQASYVHLLFNHFVTSKRLPAPELPFMSDLSRQTLP